MEVFQKCQMDWTTFTPFIDEDGRKLYPRNLVEEFSFHGFRMRKRMAFVRELPGILSRICGRKEEQEVFSGKYIYTMYAPDWLRIRPSGVLMALSPEDALEGMLDLIRESADRNLAEAVENHRQVQEILFRERPTVRTLLSGTYEKFMRIH